MPVVSMMRIGGDADELAATLKEHLEPVAERLAPKHGGLVHVIARDTAGGGLLMINVWETEEGRHAMAAEPEIQEALRAAGLPEPRFEGYEVLNLRVSDRAAAVTST